MEEGKIILFAFPQDKENKLRPAFVLRKFPKYGDFLICGITSRSHQLNDDMGIWVSEAHPDFKISGFKKPSVVRLDMLITVSEEYLKGSIGELSNETHYKLLQKLADYLIAN